MLLPNTFSAPITILLTTLCIAAPPPNPTKHLLSSYLPYLPSNPSNATTQNATTLKNLIHFHIPHSTLTLNLIEPAQRLPVLDTNMCIVETIARLFYLLLDRRLDSILPVGWRWDYGDVYFVIDAGASGSVVSDLRLSDTVVVLRGLALVVDEFRYRATAAQVVDEERGVLGNVVLWN